ncbi:MAG: hypothetical protein E4G89_07375 [Methanothrix sp.]|nr:MAG: hypothetical protein E4G89_07375 [Methanothrix sp.]
MNKTIKGQWHQVLSLRHFNGEWVIFMKKQSKSGKERQDEQMMKRLQNSLPWSLSRWLAKMWRKKK